MVHCSTVKEAETLYNEAKKNFSEVGDSDVREIVKDGIRSSIKARKEISDKPGHYALSGETGRGLRALSGRGAIRELGITRVESRGRNGPLFNYKGKGIKV